MESWLLKRQRVSVCLIVTFLSTAFGDVYLYAQLNSSIEFSCMFPEQPTPPFAFSLSREWLQKDAQVLYHNFRVEPEVKALRFENRIWDRLDINQVNVSITDLQGDDTDVYVCMFYYSANTGFQNLSGRDKFFLYVKAYNSEPCNCSSYTPLLFSLSAAAGLLFFIIFILTVVHCMRPSAGGPTKPQLSVPIYEEMNGVREKPVSLTQEEDVSLYSRLKKENPYSN
ncbi:cd7 antigen-like [Neoarius graeffei]|uniref:cd7 antigen-like n=1 Tax=Neoarius graeffei TaxID=443677 RepID=UPI00298CE65B|nr:cd7 antigen-like [Neoarius graeffei]XP_060774564.1 cd7 antigen-like [Neoarius graeffei]